MRSPHVAAQRDTPRHHRVRLLVVEDELSTVFAMREFFAQAGYDVECASGLNDAIRLLDSHAYDAVITDLHLTTLRCGEGMKIAWHARRRHPHACIVMLTGYGTEATEEEALRCGVDLYQTKPVELAHLSALVDLALKDERNADRPREVESKWRQH